MTEPSRLAAMSGPARKPLLACVLALALAGCGGDGGGGEGTLDPEQARLLEDNLTRVENNLSARRCEEAGTDADELIESVNALPEDVGSEVKEALREMAHNLEALTTEECEDDALAEEPAPDPSPALAPPPATTDTTDTETTELPEDEDQEEEDADEQEQPEDEAPDPDPGPDQVPPGQQPGGPPGQDDDFSGGLGGDEKR